MKSFINLTGSSLPACSKSIKNAFNSENLNYLGKNAIRDVKGYSWISRVKKIQKFYEKK